MISWSDNSFEWAAGQFAAPNDLGNAVNGCEEPAAWVGFSGRNLRLLSGNCLLVPRGAMSPWFTGITAIISLRDTWAGISTDTGNTFQQVSASTSLELVGCISHDPANGPEWQYCRRYLDYEPYDRQCSAVNQILYFKSSDLRRFQRYHLQGQYPIVPTNYPRMDSDGSHGHLPGSRL